MVILQGLFKNDFLGLTFKNIVGNGEPAGPDLSGTYVVEELYGMRNHNGRWINLLIIVVMIIIYRLLFFFFIKLNEKFGLRLFALIQAQRCSMKNMGAQHLSDEESCDKDI
jgi:hypothetical protein